MSWLPARAIVFAEYHLEGTTRISLQQTLIVAAHYFTALEAIREYYHFIRSLRIRLFRREHL